MLRIEVNSNSEGSALRNKVKCKKTTTLEAVYLMAVAYDLIKQNDDSGITDKEIADAIKDLRKQFNKNKKKEK